MSWGKRFLGGVILGVSGLLVGCTTGAGLSKLGPGESLVADITSPVNPRLTRSQVPEQAAQSGPMLTAPTATQQTSLVTASSVRVKVRAWVNGKPIFDDEVMQVVGPVLRNVQSLPEPQRSEKLAEAYNNALEQIIDQEVMYQNAVKRLEKNNPKALDKLKEITEQEFDKQLQKMRQGGVTEVEIKEIEHTARRLMERNLISTEYARSHILSYVQQRVTLEEIREYYEAHKNEFQTVDKVKWQDVFIAVGAKHPTVADAKRFAEGLVERCATPDDFAKLSEFDEGDSKFRGGEGLGQRRGEIKPPEVEPILFELKEGQVGPVVELPTGVHIIRVLSRENAGQIPLNDQTQKAIRKKLETQIAEREYKRLVRDLRSRSVWRVERENP
jgi:peptidyl-prolyl cis-trans isomerase SurA